MDRQIVYPGAIPLDTDPLNIQRNVMVGLSKLAAAMLGTTTLLNGLACTPTSPASLQVYVAPGEIYSLQNLDATAYGSLAADTTHQIVKQGILLDQATLSCPAPGTAGQSINYLIQVAYQDTDATPVVLPYYNASNPSTAYSGPNNAGTTNNTQRKGQCIVAVKAGAAATTGSQTTPAPDSGYVGAWVVTVANGQSTITGSNITAYPNAPMLPAGGLLVGGLQGSAANAAAAGGTSDAITATFTPGITALVNGMSLYVRAGSANATTTPTFTPASGVIAAKTIVKRNGLPLVAGDIAGGGHWIELQYDLTLDKWVLLNASTSSGSLINVQVFTSSGTYTPTPGMSTAIVEVQGGGGGGGGTPATSTGQAAVGSGGNAGSYAKSRLTAAQIGASVSVTVGAAGTGASGANGNAGGTSSFGALISCPGGAGGSATTAGTPPFVSSLSGNGSAVPTGGNISNEYGGVGLTGLAISVGNVFSGAGGTSKFGAGVNGIAAGAGASSSSKGAGGSGAAAGASTAAQAGGSGVAGLVIVWEYA